MGFLLENDVDYGVAIVLRTRGHDAVTVFDVGLAGVDSAEDLDPRAVATAEAEHASAHAPREVSGFYLLRT